MYGTLVKLPAEAAVFAVYGRSASEVYAGGKNGTILRYDGKVWAAMPAPTVKLSVRGVWVSSTGKTVLAALLSGLLRLNPQGSFEPDYGMPAFNYTSVHGLSDTDVWAVAYDGKIMHYGY